MLKHQIKQRIRSNDNETQYTKHQIAKFAKRAKAAAANPAKLEHELKHLARAQQHRMFARRKARVTHLAHMFMKRTPLRVVEDPSTVKETFSFLDVQNCVAELLNQKTPEFSQELSEWADGWFEIARAKIKERQTCSSSSVHLQS